ncbi:unnamed protein product [Timema podura]|uniref:Beta-glucuronidase n=1 Tax=Timema podura TaxID=61482 RepID=A0ABN7NKP5_TIMPD|nr:unnamed protein product [Timema podura]
MLVSSLGFVVVLLSSPIFGQGGILYPQESESRDVQSLDGIWNFRISSQGDPEQGFDEEWYIHELRKTGNVVPMPVPSSYNHITVDRSVRDFVGVVWYDRIFYVPSSWLGQRVWLRFDSAHYSAYVVPSLRGYLFALGYFYTVTPVTVTGHCWNTGVLQLIVNKPGHCVSSSYPPLTFSPETVFQLLMVQDKTSSETCVHYVNGDHVVSHDIGHLPFLVEVTDVVNYGSSNLLTVAVNNTLTRVTIPQGSVNNASTKATLSKPGLDSNPDRTFTGKSDQTELIP